MQFPVPGALWALFCQLAGSLNGLRAYTATKTSILTAFLQLMPAMASAFPMHEPGRCARDSLLAGIACSSAIRAANGEMSHVQNQAVD